MARVIELVSMPRGNSRAGLLEGIKPVIVQTFIPKIPVEALDVADMHGPAMLDQHVANHV